MTNKPDIVLREAIESKIHFLREKKIMLDSDLSKLYFVETKDFNRSVKRNLDRFPEDFMFQLTQAEWDSLRCQFGTSNPITKDSRGGRRYLPLAFTEQGVAMLSSVLNSPRAIRVNIQIMRAFTKLREMLLTHADLKKKIEEMEKKYDQQFAIVFETIKQLLEPPAKPRPKIGFQPTSPYPK